MKSTWAGVLAGAFGSALVLQPAGGLPAQHEEKVLHSFCSQDCTDGGYPDAGLIDVDGTLYGTTYAGGSTGCSNNRGCGTVLALDPKTGAEKVLYAFCSQQNCADGQYPFAGLTNLDGTLYGITNSGGAYGYGTAFALDPRTGVEKVLHSFGSGKDGFTSFASLIAVNGMLYGATEGGGKLESGTVFALDPQTGQETVLHSFCSRQNCADGAAPLGGLTGANGTLYGTTASGGAFNDGTVFALDLSTGAERVVHSFCRNQGTDGWYPYSGLVEANGMLYGTTYWGGKAFYCRYPRGCGTVFSVDEASGVETVLYSFCSQLACADGAEPTASLIDVKGILYGTTSRGGRKGCEHQGCGTAFALDPETGIETVLNSFCQQKNCADGALPQANLVDMKGALYGTTVVGGADDGGTVFVLKRP